jgi:uncharacterized membrane protein YjjP (DUF1212 family)
MSSEPLRSDGATTRGPQALLKAGEWTPSRSAGSSPSEVFPFLLELGTSLLSTRDAVSDIEEKLLEAARAYGQPDARVIVLPTAVAISGGARDPVTLSSTEDAGSQELRLDQVTEVLNIAHLAANGGLSPAQGRRRLEQVRTMPNRHGLLVRILGYSIATLGIGLVMDPAAELLPWYLALGAMVAVMQAGATRVPGLSSVLPVLAATAVSAIAFAVYAQAPLQALIPPLIAFLPGSLMTSGTVDLASEEIVTGSSRFTAGLLQLALLAVGIIAGARLVGVTPATASRAPAHPLGSWAPWLGVLVFGLGIALEHSAPERSLPWLLLVLYAAWTGQLLGAALLGARLSGFVGGLIVAPLAVFIERFPSAPPALVSFLPAFWLLVPGAFGLIGFTQLVGDSPIAGATTFIDALVSVVAIALGIMVGLRGFSLAKRAGAKARSIVLP